uniref:F-box/LRR-repeat protein 15-like leucin rich repeat domain-containing protein n=1 Tax=Ananas comosus var. bracteatus TaxID=296719 RepID=A0A6V7NUY0_ANACO|nr:unnamed protein product [Ananas comosus var. bracteatus]
MNSNSSSSSSISCYSVIAIGIVSFVTTDGHRQLRSSPAIFSGDDDINLEKPCFGFHFVSSMPSDLDAHSRPRKMPRISSSPVISEGERRKANEEEHQSTLSTIFPTSASLRSSGDFQGATDIQLAAIAVGNSSRGGLGDLLIRGSNSYGNPTCGITNRGLSAVAHACPSLRILSMWNVPLVTDISLSEIAGGCPILEKLDLTQCPLISEKGLIAVARKCRNLTSLKVQSCANIHNEGLHAIGLCCQKLNCLIIKDCPRVGDLGVSSLMASASSSLQKVKLEGLNISDISCAFVGQHGKGVSDLTLSGLQNVSKSEICITAKSLSLQNLNSITVTSCSGVTDLALESVGKCCPSLKHLPFHRSFHLSDSGLRAVTETSRTLESLQLEGCSRITLNSLSSCGKHLPKLEHIDLSGLVGLTDNGLLPFIKGSGDRLVKVNLSYCVDLTDAAIEALVKAHGRTLKLLNLDGCKKVTDKSLVAISVSCSRLKELDMSRCQISDIGIAVLASARHLHLKVLTLRSCSQVTEKSFPLLCKNGTPLGVLNLVLQADCYPRD